MEYLISLLAGTIYGFLFGLIPVAGAGTALLTIYGFLDIFRADPYTLVVFTTAIVVSSTIGDSFASVVMNIPGASGSAATMVDGFPLARQGQAARALSAAITTSTINGLIWGAAVFLLLPYYKHLILMFGIPEMLMFMLIAFTSVCFINSRYWFRGILALCLGVFLGLVGQHPLTGEARFTGGWYYLQDGIQLIPVMIGLFAVPELLEAYRSKVANTPPSQGQVAQIIQGIRDSWQHRWLGVKGGIIGAIVGLIPGIGGNIADWLAYGQTVASNKNEKITFGDGNIKGVIGCEGANNAQKATSYVPTILFGIPGAPFEVIIIALFMLVGLELGSPSLLQDTTFFTNITYSYMASMTITFVLAMIFIRWATLISQVPFSWYFWPIVALLIWSAGQYTGGWEDYLMLIICSIVGIGLKKIKFSRPALIIGFVLADKLESLTRQFVKLYDWSDIFTRPLTVTLLVIAVAAAVYGVFFNKTRINYV